MQSFRPTVFLAMLQVNDSQSLDDVVEYFTGIKQDSARSDDSGAAVFKPGWEVSSLFMFSAIESHMSNAS